MRSFLLLTVLSIGQWSSVEETNQWNSSVPQALTYAQGQKASLESGKQLWVYVGGLTPHPSNEVIVCEKQSLPGYPDKCLVISSPDKDGNHYWLKTFDQYGNEVKESVQPLAIPFDPFSPSSQRSTVQVGADRPGEGNRSLRFNASHNCPECGRNQFVVSGNGPGRTHTHTCNKCGTTWYH